MRHRFFMEDDLIKIGWGHESSFEEWETIIKWVIKTLDQSDSPRHILLDLTDLYNINQDVFEPDLAAKLAAHPRAGCLMLISHNPVFVHFVNEHWVQGAYDATGIRAFLDTTDALSWLRNKPLA